MTDTYPMEILEVFPDEDEATSMEHISAFLATMSDFGPSSPTTSVDPVPSSPSSDEAPPTINTKKRARRERPKQEIEYLHAKHADLQRQLQLLQLLRAPPKALQPWQERAMRQAEAAQRTLQENSRLKNLVEDQLKVIHTLERILTKRPRLSTFGGSHIDGKHPVLGVANHEVDLEQLLQQQYDKMDSEWIRRRLYDAAAPLKQATLERSADGDTIGLGFVAKMKIPLDFQSMADVLWSHKTGLLGPACTVLHAYHPNLVYTQEITPLPDATMPMLETRDGVRRFDEANRVVILWRSIIEDEANPHGAGHLIGSRWGWLVVEPVSRFECCLQGSMTTLTPTFPSHIDAVTPAIGTWTELLLQASQENKQNFGGIMQTAVVARRQQLGLPMSPDVFCGQDCHAPVDIV
ncbi:hypothetical protein SPRG_09536 [Saprolegnia parasitica CBS 223.65]|uniref:START domain-containing protein n=1 Tax=Saprolegnia parasitica (strain CBS 223.65) TaxID=695850 RepID=A0A067CDJ3_SAPPC|nr:hypothetical protein SPRG_09536 [Saprolegnia parasitica CBS 223.65]KDO24892.1 hypothetical protein SPRG_09536 [Saprolegnia parasitica CBS 223.65]|eukprot:XP_012204352.1 hypothetical protein SPRG_09536 [Saprolegnia parasitica CBS 223.65]